MLIGGHKIKRWLNCIKGPKVTLNLSLNYFFVLNAMEGNAGVLLT